MFWRITAIWTNTTPTSRTAQSASRAAVVGAIRRVVFLRAARGAGRGSTLVDRARVDAHAATSRCATRRRPDAARGLRASSASVGRITRLFTTRNSGPAAAAADRQVGRADAAVSGLAEAMLDDAVLERVERDHRDPAADLAHLERGLETVLELGQLVVDRDPEGLEDALRRMSLAEARGRRDGATYGVDEIERPQERPLGTPSHDRAGDRPREPLLAVAGEDAREIRLAPLVHEICGARLGVRIHPHVERGVVGVGEAALGTVELHRRDPEVEQDRVGAEPALGELLECPRERASQHRQLDACRQRAGKRLEVRRRVGIAVDRDDLAAAAQVLREQRGVPAAAEGAIHDRVAWPYG